MPSIRNQPTQVTTGIAWTAGLAIESVSPAGNLGEWVLLADIRDNLLDPRYLRIAQNLADIGSAATARTNLSAAPLTLTINEQTGTSYVLTASDNGAVIVLTNTSAITVTIPQGFAVGFNCVLVQGGAGQVSIAFSGSPSESVLSVSSQTSLSAQGSAGSLVHINDATWHFAGDLA